MTNRTLHPLLRSLAPALAAVGLFAPCAAFAAARLEVSGPATAGGNQPVFYQQVQIKPGGKLRVTQLGSDGTGRLHIKAGRIIINAGGVIDASGSGFRGVDGTSGEGTGGGEAMASGGGGAFFGAGGPGIDANCTTTYGAGGMPYGVLETFGLGSAGGASSTDTMVVGSRGGHGGGSIILEAAIIEIYGEILANGGEGLGVQGAGSGGGAGGEVRLVSNQITWGPSSLVSVAGGLGGRGDLPRSGGSGGGGLIRVRGNGPPTENVNVKGGPSAKSCPSGLGAGTDGKLEVDASPLDCLDLDGDGHPSELCGGDDCDDADAKIRPGVTEVCDTIDNDCNKKIDDIAPDECGTGNACVQGVCTPVSDAGVDDAGVPTSLESFEYAGGCAVGGAGPGGALAALAGLVGVLGARRRARPRTKLARTRGRR